MSWPYLISVYVHILCAILWIGGMLFLSVVLVPILRKPENKGQALDLIVSTGKRFKILSWHALMLLLVTGFANMHFRGWIESGPDFWGSSIGKALSYKILLFIVVIILAAVHDFKLGPDAARLMRENPGSPEAASARKKASWFGRINLLLGLIIAFLAVVMLRGYPS